MLGRRLGLAVAMASVVVGAAAARSISTGDHTRFTRDPGGGVYTAYWASSVGNDTEVRIIIYPYRKVQVGDRFDILGRNGPFGRVEVVEAIETRDACPRYPFLTLTARLTEGKLEEAWGQMVAVTPPSTKGRPRGKAAVANYDTADPEDLPPPGWAPSVMFAVDVDGDDEWDLVRYMYACPGGVNGTRYTGEGEGCVSDWHRRGKGWIETDVVRVVCR